MADFTMPSLGADMEEGKVVEWMVKPGDTVKAGDVIVVIETTKGAIETEVFESGTVGEIRVQVGETVPVGTVLATLVGNTEAAAAGSSPTATQSKPKATPEPRPEPPLRAAAQPVPASGTEVRASPAARKLAAGVGLRLEEISGSGPGGAVTLADVQKAAGATPVAKPASVKRGFDPEAMRRGIAAAMARSKREIPHYYLSSRIDVTAALQWLAAENARRKIADRLLQVVLPLKAMALALREVPELNGHYADGAFRPGAGIHIGLAIALRGGGLVAPALHDVDRKSLGELMRDTNDLITRARTGMLRSSEMTDATVTLTSLGDTGVEEIFGVIYPPQVAIVGLGKVVERPWVVDGVVQPRQIMQISLSGDHRASDGHRGAIFLNTLERLLGTPEVL